jgi:diacylglycerol kinase family enzyme
VAGIGVIYNPHARANRNGATDRIRRLETVVGDNGVMRVTHSLEELHDAIREFHRYGVDTVGVCGGDGSYHCTLSAMDSIYGAEPLPKLLPLRAGTINYVADAVGGDRGRPEMVVARLLRNRRQGVADVTTERDVMRVNGQELGFLLGFGTIVNFLRAYYAMDKQGPVQAARLLSRLIGSALVGTHVARAVFQPLECDVEIDGEKVPFRQFTFFLAATVDRIALGFRPTYLGTRKRGFFHVMGGPIPATRLIRRIVRIYRGFPTYEPLLCDNLGQRMVIQFFRPSYYMLDGDILPPQERLEIDVPRRVTLIGS